MENSIGRLCLLLAAGVVFALLPLSVAEAKTYCQDNLVQSQLKSFEKFCDQRRQVRAHCWVDTTQAPSYFICCCQD